ncbi:MAG TPA: DUF1254 domain-containing protein [Edaphobacter sp.]|jgi:hypothetical protein|nr:DUF1254 domain-containing protein [Edaphobacter sp.]
MTGKIVHTTCGIMLPATVLFVTGCDKGKKTDEGPVSAAEARAITKEAYIYGFPMAANYQTMYKQAIDTTNHDYQGPFNTLHSSKSVATPEDKFVVTPNSDTPYSYLWMDLRAEPLVVTVPKIEPNRYYTGQIVDLYTYNFAYLGTRAYGNDGGTFMIAGPGWKGATPAGVKAVIQSETQFAYIIFRTQLFNTADLPNVNKIQGGYRAQTLSAFLKQPAPAAAPAVSWPKIGDLPSGADVFPYVNFLFQFCPPNPSESAPLARFAKLNIGPGQTFDFSKFSPEIQQAIQDGIKDSDADLATVMKKINTDQISSGEMFGTRDFLKDNYLYRYAGAKLGLYGNSEQDALYFGYFVDANHQPLDASKSSYELHFAKGDLPPTKAFWSLTMYDGKTQLLVENPLKRYLLNSTMLKSYKYGSDGSLTLYASHTNPGPAKQANWLPAPDGPFYAVFRVYLPGNTVLNGTWKKPQMQPVAK